MTQFLQELPVFYDIPQDDIDIVQVCRDSRVKMKLRVRSPKLSVQA